MPTALEVKPRLWSNIIVLFDDGKHSAIWGNYEGSLRRRLATRWNDNYPRQGSYPTWYVEYDSFHKGFITTLIEAINASTMISKEKKAEYLENCSIALNEIIHWEKGMS